MSELELACCLARPKLRGSPAVAPPLPTPKSNQPLSTDQKQRSRRFAAAVGPERQPSQPRSRLPENTTTRTRLARAGCLKVNRLDSGAAFYSQPDISASPARSLNLGDRDHASHHRCADSYAAWLLHRPLRWALALSLAAAVP